MIATLRTAVALASVAGAVLLTTSAPLTAQDGGKYTIKQAKLDLPSELKPAVAKVLSAEAIQLLDGAGNAVCDVWTRSTLPSDATAEQVKNGLTYQELKESSLVGAIRVHKDWTEYRKQKVKAGVYTLRLGFQPMDGDHMGSSDYREFFVLIAADRDTGPEAIETKDMIERSMKSIKAGHPGVLMLFPAAKAPAAPKLIAEKNDHWVLQFGTEVTAAGMKTRMGFGLTVAGHAKE